jgi:hypothetical protein
MPGPFPGMDPFLEDHWGDVHTALIAYARDELGPQMPADLRVRVEEYVAVEVDDVERPYGFYPDVRVIERQEQRLAGGGTAVASPGEVAQGHIVSLHMEAPTQREIRIIDRRAGDRIVTAIEILSPTNKSRGRQDYRRKQQQFLSGGTNLIEIDLLREGSWVIAAPVDTVPEECLGPYRICVVRASQLDRCEMFPASYRFPLPTIPIPLREQDPEASLNLQALLNRAYDNGRYDDIDYRHQPRPPLPPAEAEWVDEWLKRQGVR